MELFSSKLKKFLIFFQKKFFLYFEKWDFLALSLKNFYYNFSRKKLIFEEVTCTAGKVSQFSSNFVMTLINRKIKYLKSRENAN